MPENVTGARGNNSVVAEIIQNSNVIHCEHTQDVLGEIRCVDLLWKAQRRAAKLIWMSNLHCHL